MEHTHLVIDSDTHFVINPVSRAVTNAESKKTILMQNDHNSERFTFEIDKLVEGHDMTKCNKLEIHYTNEDSNKKNKNAGVYEVTDMQVSGEDDSKLIFSWLVSENATLYAGSLKFLIVFSCVENGEVTYRWNTDINTSISISKGMNNGEALSESYPDILSQWKSDLFAAVYGMETTYVGPTEPETYPYIWFDTSNYVGSSDPNIGVITIKDADGNKYVLYPFAKLAGTDGADLEKKFNEQSKTIETLTKDKVDKANIANDLTTEVEGYILDARQGKALKDAIDTINKGKVDKSSVANNLATEVEGYILDARQGKVLKDEIDKKIELSTMTVSLPASGWVDNAITVSANGVTTDSEKIDICPAPESYVYYHECIVRCTEQGNGTLSFECSYTPTSDLTVNVSIFN